MADTPTPLDKEDYAALHTMQLSDDPAQREQAHTLAQKLTHEEQKAFYDYQREAWTAKHPGTLTGRQDNQVLGMPPEMVAAMALPVAKAATQAGLTVGQRLGATFKSALGQAHPLVKYEITKSALTHLGVPESAAMAVAIAVSGYKTGKAATAAADASPAATTATEAGTVAPVPVAPPASATAAPSAAAATRFNPGEAMATVRKVFDGISVKPYSAEISNASEMMRAGVPAETAVARVIANRPKVPVDAITALAKKLGTPDDAEVLARVAERNATGRWGK